MEIAPAFEQKFFQTFHDQEEERAHRAKHNQRGEHEIGSQF